MSKGMMVSALLVVLATAVNAGEWPSNLWLGRGGFWQQRVSFAVPNSLDKDAQGVPVAIQVGNDVGKLPLAGARVEELRLIDSRGVELLWNVRKGKAVVESGKIPEGAIVTVPLCAPTNAAATYCFYFDNPSAWGLADRLNAEPQANAEAIVGPVERINLANVGEKDVWPTDADWDFRVPVRVMNDSADSQNGGEVLVSFPLQQALYGARNPEWEIRMGGIKHDCCQLGQRVLFKCKVPPKSILTCYLYVRSRSKANGEGEEKMESKLGSTILSDQVLVEKLRVKNEQAFEQLLKSSANLVKNPTFADNGKDWWGEDSKTKRDGVVFEVPRHAGKFGNSYAKLTIPKNDNGSWIGWHQTVPLKPHHSYLFGGYIACSNLSGRVSICAHEIGTDGKVICMPSTGEYVVGTEGWKPSFGFIKAKHDAKHLTLHLTTKESGTLMHDGIIVAECLPGLVGDAEMRSDRNSEAAKGADAKLKVMQVDPVIKVFRETAVRESAKGFSVSLAQNETEALQLAVRANGDVDDLSVEVVSPGDGIAVDVGVVGFVPVDYPTAYYNTTTPKWELKHPMYMPSADGWSGWWPDPIMPTNRCTLVANRTQPIWINLTTTASTKPGVHHGEIIWKQNGRELRRDKFRVKVWNFAIPQIPEAAAIYDVRLGHRWNADFKGLDKNAKRRKIWKFYSEKRISPDSFGDSLKFSKGKDGKVTADFTEYDRLANEFFNEFKFPFSYMPHAFTCFGWGMPPAKFMGEEPYEGKWPYDDVDRSKLRKEYVENYQAALRLYWDHVKANGWDKRLVLYISDEPFYTRPQVKAQMKALCAMIHQVDPKIRIYSSTWHHCEGWEDSLDIWGVGHYGGFPVEKMKSLTARGKGIWFTTDGQMCLDTPYCSAERLFPHYCSAYNAEAYEFWGATWLTYDPWKFGWHSFIPQSDTPGKSYYVRYPDGDGYLMYPGIPGKFSGPVTCVRLEAARDGVEDFTYLKRLKAMKDDRAKKLLAEFEAIVTIPNAGGRFSTKTLPEPEKLGILRERAGDLISERK